MLSYVLGWKCYYYGKDFIRMANLEIIIRMRATLLLVLLIAVLAVFAPPSFAAVLANITPSPEPATATPIVPLPTNTPIIAPTNMVPTNTPIIPLISTPSLIPPAPSATPVAKKHHTELDTPTPTASVPPTEPPTIVLTSVPTESPTIIPTTKIVPVSRPRPAPARLPRTGADDGTSSTVVSWFLFGAMLLVICGYLIRSKWSIKHRHQ